MILFFIFIFIFKNLVSVHTGPQKASNESGAQRERTGSPCTEYCKQVF